MLSPWPHPESGIFYLYAQVPERLKEVAGRTHFKRSLHTRCPKQAKEKWPAMLAFWQATVMEWERRSRGVRLDGAAARRIAAEWALDALSGSPPDRQGINAGLLTITPEPEQWVRFLTRVKEHAAETTARQGIEVAEGSLPALWSAFAEAVHAVYIQMELRDDGVVDPGHTDPSLYAPGDAFVAAVPACAERLPARPDALLDPTAARMFPSIPTAAPAVRTSSPAVTKPDDPLSFDAIWTAWKRVTATKARTVDETLGMLRMLANFLGHDDARRVTRDDLRRWRDHLKVEGLANSTWNNRLSLIRQVFLRAVEDEDLPHDPTEKLRLPKGKAESPLPYTDGEAAAILTRAREEATPMLRWSHWIMAFTGMRVGEVLQLSRDDLRQDPDSGIWMLAVHENAEGNSVKTGMPRNVPVHPVLVEEGFVDYGTSVKAGDPLFPDKGKDKYGRRSGRGWNAVGTWVRETVGITDPQKAPNHSWRHRMEDELRAAEVPEDVRDAILGHARKTTGRQYGVRGEALSRLHRELSRVRSPLTPRAVLVA